MFLHTTARHTSATRTVVHNYSFILGMIAGLLMLLFILGCLAAFALGIHKRSWRIVVISLLLSEIALLFLQMLALRQYSAK